MNTNYCFVFVNSFRWINSLESLILEGCELMDDSLFTHLISSLILSENSQIIPIEDKQECLLENLCCQYDKFNKCLLCTQCSQIYSKSSRKFQLKILNLSGCYRFTDYGLK